MGDVISIVIFETVLKHFDGDTKVTAQWMATENPLLGNITPNQMMRNGRSAKLYKFIMESLGENKKPDTSTKGGD